MNIRRGISFSPDRDALAASDRRTLTKAFTCFALAAARQARPDEIRQGLYPGDDDVARVVRAAVSPASTTSTSALRMTGSKVLPAIAPASAALKLFKLGMQVDLAGVAEVKLPGILSVPPAIFVAEGQPSPVVQFDFTAPSIGPLKKILLNTAISGELENATAGTAESIVARALNESASKGIDAVALSDDAATTAAPAGLRFGVTPIPSTGSGFEIAATDIAKAVAAMAAAGIDGSDAVIIAPADLVVKLLMLAGPRFTAPIFGSLAMPDDTVIVVAPSGIASALDAPTVEASFEVAVHYEDVAPLAIASGTQGSGVLATPVRSAYQQNLIVLRLRAKATWVALPGAVQVISGVNW